QSPLTWSVARGGCAGGGSPVLATFFCRPALKLGSWRFAPPDFAPLCAEGDGPLDAAGVICVPEAAEPFPLCWCFARSEGGGLARSTPGGAGRQSSSNRWWSCATTPAIEESLA